jgi:hypothetical protein
VWGHVGKRAVDCRGGVRDRGVDQRDRAVLRKYEESELCAAQDDGLRPAAGEVRDRGLELLARGGQEYALGELRVQGVVDVVLVLAFRDQDVEVVARLQARDEGRRSWCSGCRVARPS